VSIVVSLSFNGTLRIGNWIQHHQRLSQLIGAILIIAVVIGATLAIVARQTSVAAQQARFNEMGSVEREVEVQLIAAGRYLSVDVRFMQKARYWSRRVQCQV
jgi:eukaryotic-like serine/threonine-protein kinase